MATFNIEDYLNSLPEDIEVINISEKNLTYIPSLERFRKLKELDCTFNQLISLPNTVWWKLFMRVKGDWLKAFPLILH